MPRNRHLEWTVPYAPGRLEARGYAGGRLTARAVRETAGPAKRVVLTADRRLLSADGDDVAILRAEVVDARGNTVPDAANLLRFTVRGDAEIIGVGNGNPTSLEADRADQRRAFHGLAQVIVRSGARSGPIVVDAHGDGLASGRAVLVAQPV
jgi:beta-galactosidase